MSRSWFYLTLWHGTPPEFTEEVETEIETSSNRSVALKILDTMGSTINTMVSTIANITNGEATSTDIITTTEVVWYVG